MGFGSEPANSTFEDWAIADGGKTLFTHSEMFEGKHDRRWIECLSSSSTIRFKFDTRTPRSRPASWLRHSSLPDVLTSGAHPLEVNDGVVFNSLSLVIGMSLPCRCKIPG
jgi:hypothetical protein